MVSWFVAKKYIFSRFISFAAFLLVSLGVAILIILLAVMEGFKTDMIARIRGTSSDIRVKSTRFVGMDEYPRVQTIVEKIPGVRAMVPYVETLVMYTLNVPESLPDRSGHLNLNALDLENEAKVGELAEYLSNYKAANPRQAQPAGIEEALSRKWIEEDLWRQLNRRPPANVHELRPVLLGAETFHFLKGLQGVQIDFQTVSPVTTHPRLQRFIIAGFFQTKDVLVDTQSALMDIEDAKEFLDLEHPETRKTNISGLRVFLEPGRDADRVKSDIVKALNAAEIPFVTAQTWREEKAKILRAVEMEKSLVGIILGVIILFIGLMVFIILTVQVVEKTKDLGILQSIGMTPRGIVGIYLRIGALICATGIAFGTLYGVLFCVNIDTIQRWVYILTEKEVFPKNVYYIDSIPVRLVLGDFLAVIIPTVLFGFLASLLAARRAARTNPLEALRHE